MKNIILENETHSPERTGAKAANLARLKRAGFAVPSFVTILPSAFRDDGRWQDHLLEDELKEARRILRAHGALLAVRSSALDEDGAITSFAGQLDSFLNVSSEWVITAARSVWLSGSNERLKAYCSGMGITTSTSGPAIIVQRMVDAKVAGVAFSADPVSGDRHTVVISAVRGLADRLVSGEVEGNLFYVQSESIVRHRNNSCLNENDKSEPFEVADQLLLEIANVARRIESLFGCPQDIEWAHDGTQLCILQARAITTLPKEKEAGSLRIWDNSNIAESYQGVTTPLTFSFAAKAYEHVYIQFCKLMGVSRQRIQANKNIFPRMLGFIRGRIYYNLVNWYRLLALLPGFQVNRPFMEQMMGVKEELPEEIIEQFQQGERENGVSAARAYADFLVSLAAMLVRFVNLKSEIDKFQKHFESTIESVPKDLNKLNSDQLAQLYRGLENKLLSSLDAPLVNDFFAMIFFGLLGSLSQKWFAAHTNFSHHELLVHSGGIVSTEPTLLIAEMAAAAREDQELLTVLKTGSMLQIERQINQNNRFKSLYANYLKKFGDRCFNELKLESPTLNDNPLPLLKNIGAMASSQSSATQKHQRPAAVHTAKDQMSKLPLVKRAVFTFVANQAVERIRLRENLRFERTRLFGLVRRIFLELGKRFEDSEILLSKNDIFYLEVEEVLNFIEGKSTTANLAELAELRKRESATFKKELPPPNRIVTRQTVIHNAGPMPCTAPNHAAIVHGLGCSPGSVRGRVRVVRDPASAKPLEDEILVAERTDPGWILLFAQAKGIIVEYGSLLSHTAIVSRELGIPAIVSARGVTNWLSDGDLIEFDGKTGIIEKLTEDSTPATEHDLEGNVVKLIESTGLCREAS